MLDFPTQAGALQRADIGLQEVSKASGGQPALRPYHPYLLISGGETQTDRRPALTFGDCDLLSLVKCPFLKRFAFRLVADD